MPAPLNILHMHSSFDLGGKEARAVRLMNAFGDRASHAIVSAVPYALGAREAIAPGIEWEIPLRAPPLAGRLSAARLEAIAWFMRPFDLVLTYNWGAMDAVMARRIFARHGLPPLVHHEDGFNADEAERLKSQRNLYRRLALPVASALVVPSHRLEGIARNVWKEPAVRVHRIANGVPVAGFARKPKARAIPGLKRKNGELIVGTVAGLRPVKNLPRLVRAVAAAGDSLRLVIVGEGPERDAILAEAKRLGIAHRLLLPGFLPRPQDYVGLFDIFALSSDSEQAPIALIEAMAAGLPVAATDVGDVAEMVATANRRFIVPPEDEPGFAAALRALAADASLRRALGTANRAQALEGHDEAVMIAAYRRLYEEAVGRPGALAI